MRDAELRAADCFYALKSFDQAAEYYDRVLERDVEPLDYALFQRAMSAKLDEDLEGQTDRLDQFLEDHPDSRLVVEALFQAGRSHIERANWQTPNPSSSLCRRLLCHATRQASPRGALSGRGETRTGRQGAGPVGPHSERIRQRQRGSRRIQHCGTLVD